MPFKQPTTTYEEARKASRAVRERIQPRADGAQPPSASSDAAEVPLAAQPEADGVATPAPTPRPATALAAAPEAVKAAAIAATASQAAARPQVAAQPDKRPRGAHGRKVMLSLSVPFPAQGVSASFDAIASHHDGNTAMKTLLKRAMPAYEERIRSGRMADVPEDYPVGEEVTDTTRMMDSELVNVARQHFDPFGVLSMRALARKIACSALAALFAEERAR